MTQAGCQPIQRVYNFRSALKSKTDLLVPGHYGCKPGCSEIVEWLLYDSHYLYQCKPEVRYLVSSLTKSHITNLYMIYLDSNVLV